MNRIVRCSDDERSRCVETLREAYFEGRLEEWELEERVELAWSSRTRGDLAVLVRDLPRAARARAAASVAVARRPSWVAALDQFDRALLRGHAAVFSVVNGSFVGVWATTGQGDFWPAWLLVPWGPVMAWHAAGSWGLRRLVRGAGRRLRPVALR